MIDQFGWKRGYTAFAVSFQRLEGGMISPFVGTLINRYGTRRVMSFGVFVTGLSFILMSQIQNIWQYYLVILLLTVGMSFGTFIVLVVTVGNWFVRKRARALGLLMSASGLGGFAVFALGLSVESFGWREVLFAIGIGFWIVGFPAMLAMRQAPEQYGMRPDGDTDEEEETKKNAGDAKTRRSLAQRDGVEVTGGQSLKMRFFWQLAIASSLGQFVSASNITHIDALTENGLSGGAAAAWFGMVAFGDLAGRLAIAAFGDRMNKKIFLAAAFAIEGVGIMALALVNREVLGVSLGQFPIPVYAIGFGLGFGASVPLRLALLADYFGRKSYGNIVGLTSSINSGFGAVGAAFAGFMFDWTGSYMLPFLVMGILLATAVPMTLALESESRVAARSRQARTHP